MLAYDPIPWLMRQEGVQAVRGRRLVGLRREDDAASVQRLQRELAGSQLPDGSFDHSPMKTAGVLNLLADLRADDSAQTVGAAAGYLFNVLASQAGYRRARRVKPGSVPPPYDLCGFFGPIDDRWRADVLADGATEMNFYREYEPLLGPQSPVRGVRRSSLDRPGPGTCYAWGLVPLAYTTEALCRAGHANDRRLEPALNALLGVQRANGGWCGCGGGHPSCTTHAVRALVLCQPSSDG